MLSASRPSRSLSSSALAAINSRVSPSRPPGADDLDQLLVAVEDERGRGRRALALGGGHQVDAPAQRVDPGDLDADRIAETYHAPRVGADQHRLVLVQLPPLAAHLPQREEALESLLAERHERAARDERH